MTDKPTNDVRRIDSAGRDVTDLPGLWGEEDSFVAPTSNSDVWCVYDPEDGLEEFTTKEEAILAAQRKIETYRDYKSQEWIDGVEQIVVLKKVCGVRDVSQVPEYQDWRIEG